LSRLTIIKPRLTTSKPTIRNVTTATERTRGHRWMAIRGWVLMAEPRCAECLRNGRLAAAVEVDHIIPLRRGGTDDVRNLQGLCHDCHAAKTKAEQAA
jgi:5-methylcytosine-specific restriction enzyme A